MMIFSQKLGSLDATVAQASAVNVEAIAREIQATAGTTVVAIGSGGSVASAELFATLRGNAQMGPTIVLTPMEYTLGAGLNNLSTWLFSAGGNNADIGAAFEASILAEAPRINIVTNNVNSTLTSRAASSSNASVHVAPVFEPKDGFLATHSLISTASVLIRSFDSASGDSLDGDTRQEFLVAACRHAMSQQNRNSCRSKFANVLSRDRLLLLHDPALKPAAVAIETSFWEAGLGAVQRTDFRNFAHGRHTGLLLDHPVAGVLAFPTEASKNIWNAILAELPTEVAVATSHYGVGGSKDLFGAFLESLVLIEARAQQTKIDPGKPSVPEFGKKIYALPTLLEAVEQNSVPIRRKLVARRKADVRANDQLEEAYTRFVNQLRESEIGAVVLDYDGTVVETAKRYQPPEPDVVRSIIRIIEGGLRLAFATGRGGSLGESLRPLIPEAMWSSITVGYYNGGHLTSLDCDIAKSPPATAPEIEEIGLWLDQQLDLFVGSPEYKLSPLQISIDSTSIRNASELVTRLFHSQPSLKDSILVRRSGHSVDILPRTSSKTRVVAAMEALLQPENLSTLCIGDSGAWNGNDHELLAGPFSLSVADVCHRTDVCWNLMPRGWAGPRGLVRILDSLHFTSKGTARIDVDAILTGIAQPDQLSTKEEHVRK
jgi:hydroxymethylpyrimidine pyrophosphatase-like HAD family hydrolase